MKNGKLNSCIYEGWVRHRRFSPVENHFTYSIFMMYLDLAELETVFRGRMLWSAKRCAPAWFRRKDHLGDPRVPLDTAVRDLVEERTGNRPGGPIRLLTHLRYFGYCMNPVSFYYCYDEAHGEVETIVAEVQNTPWREMHCYVLDRNMNEREGEGEGVHKRFRFTKDFHVSPFMSMEQQYDWQFTDPGERLPVHMRNSEDGRMLFDATMVLERRPITSKNLTRVLLRYPLMTVQVIALIHWQALKLWWKRCPFYPHPKHRIESARQAEGAA